ncbi:MAG: ribonuclease H-like domain-containing protein [Candidatus Jorgensenbacteria bacterium]|nr:ribonuclease H-like domain-containing protein [Candidatus Jorgensenbacteria bacterium]
MRDKIVFDIETKNTFADVGGYDNVGNLDVSVVCLYSYNDGKYQCFTEHEMGKLEEVMKYAYLIIGFASKRFDVPVLAKYFKFNLASIPHFDILEEVEKNLKRRIGLNILAEANLGVGKTAKGLEATDFYRNGEMEKLKDYCTNDVKITKDIYELIKNQGYLWIPERGIPQMKKLEMNYKELEMPPAGLL